MDVNKRLRLLMKPSIISSTIYFREKGNPVGLSVAYVEYVLRVRNEWFQQLDQKTRELLIWKRKNKFQPILQGHTPTKY